MSSTKSNPIVAVIGAGPAGVTAAYQLTKAGIEVHIYEASEQVGGLAKTIDLWNQRVDLGPHRFFSFDERVNKLWFEVAGPDYRMVKRITRIYYQNNFFNYPLTAFDTLSKLGIINSIQCILSYLLQKIKPTKNDNTFESWVTRRFGKQLFTIFFKTYSEKLWGIACDELDADFAKQRIKKFSLGEAIKKAFSSDESSHKTLISQFAYPTQGSGMIYERMANFVATNGGKVFTNTAVKRVLTSAKNVTGIELQNGETHHYSQVVSTMPLPILVSQLPDVPTQIKSLSNQLKFRNTILVYLCVDAIDLFPDNWLYIHSSNVKMGRVTNFRNWVPDILNNEQKTIIALEYWCNEHDDVWNMDNTALIQLAKSELETTNLLKGNNVVDGKVHRINRCYPIYHRGYKDQLKPIEEYLNQFSGLHIIGRYGAFKYNNQDHSILMGILAAENITNGNKINNLWDINTDYDSYQEDLKS